MSKYYLFTSDDDKNDDTLVRLDSILTIRLIRYPDDDYVIVVDYTNQDAVKMRFKDEESLRAGLVKLLHALGEPGVLADKMKIYDRNSVQSDKQKFLKLLADSI